MSPEFRSKAQIVAAAAPLKGFASSPVGNNGNKGNTGNNGNQDNGNKGNNGNQDHRKYNIRTLLDVPLPLFNVFVTTAAWQLA